MDDDRDVVRDAEEAITRSRTERLKAEQAKVIGRLQRAREQLEAKRPNSRTVDAVFGALERDVAAGGGVLAGAVAFRVFLFMIPYVFLLVMVFGLGASVGSEDPVSLARDAGIGGLAGQAFGSVGELSTQERILSFFVAAFALLLATRALLKALRIVHALVWRTPTGKQANMARAAGFLVLLISLVLVLTGLVGTLRGDSFLLGLLATVLFMFVPFVMWLVVSWYMPHAPDVPWTALVPGAAVFGVGVEVLHLITVYWIAHQLEHKTNTYGAIGFALALLLWSYLLGRLITSAAVLNETLWAREVRRRQARAARARRSPGIGHEPTQHAPGAERRDPRVEPHLDAAGRDDQGELGPRRDRGGPAGRGRPPES
jgi:uncharacterized BrkB/YihY/UPF0761 family membrane protein